MFFLGPASASAAPVTGIGGAAGSSPAAVGGAPAARSLPFPPCAAWTFASVAATGVSSGAWPYLAAWVASVPVRVTAVVLVIPRRVPTACRISVEAPVEWPVHGVRLVGVACPARGIFVRANTHCVVFQCYSCKKIPPLTCTSRPWTLTFVHVRNGHVKRASFIGRPPPPPHPSL